jgi:hypothetical protein
LANLALVAGMGWGKCHEKIFAGNCPGITLRLRWFKWTGAGRSAFPPGRMRERMSEFVLFLHSRVR